jgi:hypothetical protein
LLERDRFQLPKILSQHPIKRILGDLDLNST